MIEIHEEDPVQRTFILFAQTMRVVAKFKYSYMNKKAGLSDVKFIVLLALYQPGAVLTASEIAQWTDTESHNITTLIDRMKEDGLIDAKRNERDKRFLKVTLTDKGREVLWSAMPAAKEVVDQVMSSVTKDDALSFEKVLRVMRQNAYNGLERLAKSS